MALVHLKAAQKEYIFPIPNIFSLYTMRHMFYRSLKTEFKIKIFCHQYSVFLLSSSIALGQKPHIDASGLSYLLLSPVNLLIKRGYPRQAQIELGQIGREDG